MVAIGGFAIGWPDGYAGAPVGSPQFPTLLNGYTARTPWHVAGVDYAVGIPSGTVLKDPFQGLTPSNGNLDPVLVALGGSYDSGNIIINFAGVNNANINGWDFSLNGGQRVAINADGCIFQNNNCKVGTTRRFCLSHYQEQHRTD